MDELKELDTLISEMRNKLHLIIETKENLLDPEVIAASQDLDRILNEHSKLINK